MASITTRRMKELHHEIAQKWGIPVGVLAGSTFGLGVTMMYERGYAEEQIIDMVRCLLGDITGAPETRGAS